MDEMFDILTLNEHEMECTDKLEGCEKEACHKFDVFVPFKITPFGIPKKDKIQVKCNGELRTLPGNQCDEHKNNVHEFTVAQEIKVLIPIKFGAQVCFDESCSQDLGECDGEHDPTGITLCHSNIKIDRGKTHQFTATVLPEDAKDKSVTWKSDNETYVTISATGLATGVRRGTTTITGTTVNGISAHCTVEVQDEND